MKKLILIILVFIGLSCISCNSIDTQLGKYEQACEQGDYEKASAINIELGKEIAKHPGKWTAERNERYTKATMKLTQKTAGDIYEKAKEQTDKAYEDAQKEYDKTLKEAKDEYDKAYKEASKTLGLEDDDDDYDD